MKNKWTTMVLLCTAFILSASASFDVPGLARIPNSKASIMLDGKLETGEWDKALKLRVNDSLDLYFQQDAANLYLCLANPYGQPTLMGVDFYLEADDKRLVNLHASAKLGERRLKGQDYGDWNWWNNRLWYANVVRFGNDTGPRFLFDEAKEFQIRKGLIKGKKFKLMLEISYPPYRSTTYPKDASPVNSEKWLVLSL